jgi:hypothetical protein
VVEDVEDEVAAAVVVGAIEKVEASGAVILVDSEADEVVEVEVGVVVLPNQSMCSSRYSVPLNSSSSHDFAF